MRSSLLLIHAAMDVLPYRGIRVATMGWILKYATGEPLKAPKSIATTPGCSHATIMGACAGIRSGIRTTQYS